MMMTTYEALALAQAFTVVWLASWAVGAVVELLRKSPRRRVLAASIIYHNIYVEAFEGDADLVAGVCRMMLLVGNHIEDVDDDFVNDISVDEASDASYGRVTLTTVAMTDDDANDRAELDFDDVVFSALANETVTEAVAYLQVGVDDTTPANDPLIALWDIADTAADGSDFTLQVGTEGAIQFS